MRRPRLWRDRVFLVKSRQFLLMYMDWLIHAFYKCWSYRYIAMVTYCWYRNILSVILLDYMMSYELISNAVSIFLA